MKLKHKIFSIITALLSIIESDKTDFEKYKKLKINNVPSIEKSDLPPEFGEKSFKIVDEFIKKTINLDYEILIYFDYITGDLLKCKIGTESSIEVQFKDREFEGKHVASLHNHTKDMYTPPSNKNFGIFSRSWEDYELIASNGGLWILKGKHVDKKLTEELQKTSSKLFISSHHYCSKNLMKLMKSMTNVTNYMENDYQIILTIKI